MHAAHLTRVHENWPRHFTPRDTEVMLTQFLVQPSPGHSQHEGSTAASPHPVQPSTTTPPPGPKHHSNSTKGLAYDAVPAASGAVGKASAIQGANMFAEMQQIMQPTAPVPAPTSINRPAVQYNPGPQSIPLHYGPENKAGQRTTASQRDANTPIPQVATPANSTDFLDSERVTVQCLQFLPAKQGLQPTAVPEFTSAQTSPGKRVRLFYS